MTLRTQSDRALPSIFYGTAWKEANTTALVTLALNSGFRAVDTACQPKHYREDLVGVAVASASIVSRAELFLQTKFTLPENQRRSDTPYDLAANLEDQVRQSAAKSLQNLQTEYLDAILLHSPAQNIDRTLSIINILRELKENGQVRHIGLSNITSLQMLQEICSALPASTVEIVQNRFVTDTGYDLDIRAYCKERGIVYQSFWTLSGNPHILGSDELKRIASRLGTSAECAFYRFCMQEGITVLDGTTSEDHMKEDLEVVASDRYQLGLEDMSDIRALLQPTISRNPKRRKVANKDKGKVNIYI
jgi:diketogulonate reductase-like aldo/keto reductase